MNCHSKMLLFAFLALAVIFFSGAMSGAANTELQQPKPAAQEEEQESPPGYEDEYNCYDAASKEPDLLKRGTMLIGCIEKYPKSTLMRNYEAAYQNSLIESSSNKKYAELETLGEQWLKLHPNDPTTIAYIATAAKELGHDEKYLQSLIEIYKAQPTADLARDIAETYDNKMKNKAKYLEWIDTALKYPEYESNFMLRADLVKYYMEANNLAKAAEYSRATLKAADLVKDPGVDTQKQLRAVRHVCNDIIGRSLIDKDKFTDAIKSFQQALKAKKYPEGYYYIGLCEHKLGNVEDAMYSYAKAELQGGEIAPSAKKNLEQIYMALHNKTLIGIEKVYKKAKELPETYWTSSGN